MNTRRKAPFSHTNEREQQHTVMEEAEDEATTENTTSTTTTGPPPPPPAMMIPTFANARNRALDEAIAEHAEQVLKREKDARRHANLSLIHI